MQIKIGLATDFRGVPILFDMYPGSLSDVVLTKRFVNSIRARGKDCLFVMDNGLNPPVMCCLCLRMGLGLLCRLIRHLRLLSGIDRVFGTFGCL
ncbi:MAG: hypothetical protein LBQ98_01560 [Nitrososphaerota archaeon]|nr:hypothetical protein [Nitrososphaerota archaeon]